MRLTSSDISSIVAAVPGGARNVQDIYPLAPLQDGILFHHLLNRNSDPYIIHFVLRLDSRERLDAYLAALQAVIDRHDILRTSFFWEGISEAAQVVWRSAPLAFEELSLESDIDVAQYLISRFGAAHFRIDIRRAPLIHAFFAPDLRGGDWVMIVVLHHLVVDHETHGMLQGEIRSHLLGEAAQLPAPVPFRNFVAHAQRAVSREEHQAFFREMLSDVRKTTAPFGLLDVHEVGFASNDVHWPLKSSFCTRLRASCQALSVSPASVFHVAWGRVLSALCNSDDVVFGTVVLGRMQGGEGAGRGLGLFMNTLPIRLTIGARSVREHMEHTHRLLADVLHHEHASLTLAQRCSAVPAPEPLFTTLLNYRHNSTARGDHLDGIEVISVREMGHYPVTISINDWGTDFSLSIKTHASVDSGRVAILLQRTLEEIVAALEDQPQRPLRDLQALPAAELEQLLVHLNATEGQYASDCCIHELFEAQVMRDPDAVAVVGDNATLSYGELNADSNRLARCLRQLGAVPDTRVAVCMERGVDAIVAIMAVLKAGAGYVPLDQSYPRQRLAYMLEDSQPIAILTHGEVQSDVRELLGRSCRQVLDVRADQSRWEHCSAENLDRGQLAPSHLAYVIYTSGSTGQPKGVLVEHGGLCNLSAHGQRLEIDGTSRVLQFASLSFDASVFEIVMALCNGASLHVPLRGATLVGRTLIEVIERREITHALLPPSVLAALPVAAKLQSLRVLLVGGEAPTEATVKRWASGRRLVNAYGPTESTVLITLHDCDPNANGNPPIGRPITNGRLYILDEHLAPVLSGVTGELYIGGVGVARGYLNRPDLTSERFIPSPFVAGDRLYQTGDLARYRPDGNVEFMGRRDGQVKLRGFRIELGEIETQMRRHSSVADAAVLLEDIEGDPRLIAYYLASGAIDVEALRSHLAASLPEHMIPAAYARLTEWPLTPNGKLDRSALSSAIVESASSFYDAPVGEIEATMARLWCELLKVDPVGRNDDFFELGGHSLLAVRLVSRLRKEFGLDVDISEVFDRPILREFSQWLMQSARSTMPAIVPVRRDQPLPLSFAQQRLWFLAQMDGVSVAYHIPLGIRLRGALDRDALRRTLDRLVARHEALRTRFVVVAGDPTQEIADATAGFALEEDDLRGRADAEHELRALSQREAVSPFDLETGPLVRGRLIQLSTDEHVLLITMHHIVSDGWSMGVILRELSVLYTAYHAGQADPLEPLPVQYADYAVWQRRWLSGAVLEEQSEYWKSCLSDAPVLLELPTDRPRPADQDHRGAQVAVELDAQLTTQLRALSQRHGVTLYMTLLTAWGSLLSRLSGQDDVVIGTPVANRTRTEIDDVIGFFVNTLAIRLDYADDGGVSDVLARVKSQTLQAQQHQDLPFEQVVELLNPPRSLAHSAIFQAMFAWQNNEEGKLLLPGLQLTSLWAGYPFAKFDITLDLSESAEGIDGMLEYATALFDRTTAERYVGYLETVLAAMVADENQVLSRISLLSAAERDRVVLDWNATDAAYPSDRCIHELFEEQASRNPDAMAVVCEETELSYGELNARANRLAHYLRECGVGPESRVAVCMERSVELVVALMAVLKAGGAYVPLDPSYPIHRLAHVLDDSTPFAVITHSSVSPHTRALFAQHTPIGMESAFDLWSGASSDNLDRGGLTPANLAYVIYTSGSAGQPKGVMVAHRNVSNLLTSFARTLAVNATDRLLALTTIAFDIAALEIFMPLICGACVIILEREKSIDAAVLAASISTQQPTLIQATPATWRLLIESGWAGAQNAQVLCGGEALPPDLAERIATRVRAVWNVYGPTETTVWSTFARIGDDRAQCMYEPIGRPIQNTRIYIVDDEMQPVPVGVPGELYIGGAGVSRGYFNRPELTSERFIASPFVTGDRLYKTGDLARYLPDGNVEFLGRNDDQVKVRGFRIELGEIENTLLKYTGISQATVVAQEHSPGEKRLLAYVVPKANFKASAELAIARETAIEQWGSLWGDAYDTAMSVEPSFVGWNSSYTNEPIPLEHMEEWLRGTAARILELRPKRVLEIGCGVGLILRDIAPYCEKYVGIDLSASAIANLSAWVRTREDLAHVELMQGGAQDIGSLADYDFDTVVLNSVVQYFPDADYLLDVLRAAVQLLGDDGHVFVGDVRHLGLQSAFHASVQVAKSKRSADIQDLRKRIRRAVRSDKELLLDPQAFCALPERLGVGAAEIQLKRGTFDNELTRYRYDAILHVGPVEGLPDAALQYDSHVSMTDLKAALRERVAVVRVNGLRNPRVAGSIELVQSIEGSDAHATLVEAQARENMPSGLGPDAFWALGDSLGYETRVSWTLGSDEGCFDVVFFDSAQVDGGPSVPRFEASAFERFVNNPTEERLNAELPALLRLHLQSMLPDYMIPAAIVLMREMPLTPNGKVDRKALPPLDDDAYAMRAYEEPVGGVEQALSEIWGELLHVDRVGRNANFFELGGHSLLAMRLLARVRQVLEVETSLKALFQHPVLHEFAQSLMQAARSTVPAIVPVRRDQPLPLSFAQQRLWFLAQMDGVSAAYHIPVGIRLRGALDRDALRRALDRLATRHETLRTRFVIIAGDPTQEIGDATAGFALEEHDLRGRADAEHELRALSQREAVSAFDLQTGPLIRGRLIQLSTDEHVLLITMHHIISDGWSTGVLLRELSMLYAAYHAGRADPLEPLPVQYADYAVWQRRWLSGAVLEEQSEYWKSRLSDAPALLELPTDRPRPADQDHRGAHVPVELDAQLTAQLRALSQRHGATLYMTLLTAWGSLLSRLSGQGEVVIGTPVANRTRTEVEELIGFFVNTLAVRLDYADDGSVSNVLARVKSETLQAQQHQDLPFEQVVELVNPPRSLAHSAIFQAMFAWQNNEDGELLLPGLEVTPLGTGYPFAKFDMTLHLSESDEGIGGMLEYATALFDRATAERHVGYLETVLAAMVADENQVLSRVPLLSAAERDQVVLDWNATDAAYPSDRCIHELFEERASHNPDAVAVVYEETELRYGELNARANQLAHYLRECGVGPESRAAVCMERSIELVVALLAVLKAGGAYVPLDPSYPVERLSYILEDSSPSLLLMYAVRDEVRAVLTGCGVRVLDMDMDASLWSRGSSTDGACGELRPEHIAGVAYAQAREESASGFVGRPAANTRAYILDEHLQPVPAGAMGDLYVGGARLARGYWNRQKPTAQEFIDSPFVAGDRIYKTGERAFYGADGAIILVERYGRALGDDAYGTRGYEEPIGRVETTIAQVWCKVLDIERVGRTENFFELGGHSLLVPRVVADLSSAGLRTSFTNVFRHPTLKNLAAQFVQESSDNGYVDEIAQGVSVVRQNADGRNLFFVHDMVGTDAYAWSLGRHLDPALSVYGLLPPSGEEADTMELIAKRMVSNMRSIQPFGPYRVGGWSFGGFVAYEIATQLIEQGERVAFLGLIDTCHPVANRAVNKAVDLPMDTLNQILLVWSTWRTPLNERQRAVVDRIAPIVNDLHFDDLVHELRKAGIPSIFGTYDVSINRVICTRIRAHRHAEEVYEASALPIVPNLFVAAEKPKHAEFLGGDYYGWDRLYPRERIRVRKVCGTHDELVGPHARDLGRAMSEALDDDGVGSINTVGISVPESGPELANQVVQAARN